MIKYILVALLFLVTATNEIVAQDIFGRG